MAAAEEMTESLTPELIGIEDRPQMTTTLEGYYSMKPHVLVRFGKWQEIIDLALPPRPDLYLASMPMWHYAKGIAYAALGEFEQADRQYDLFKTTRNRIPQERKIFNNTVIDILAIAEQMLLGEIHYHKGHYDIAFRAFKKERRIKRSARVFRALGLDASTQTCPRCITA